MSTSITTTKSTEGLREGKSSRYHSLVQKKAELEKRLNEKYEKLHQLCKKEADLVGNNFDLTTNSASNLSAQQQQLLIQKHRYKIQQNEINKLLIEKQKQQQHSQNSFSIANDPTQLKSLRRTHKKAYEVSQQKIEQLNENINILAQKRYELVVTKAQDDIALHRCDRSDNRYVKNALAMVGNNARNLHMLNANNNIDMSERRNSMKSTTSSLGSSNTFIVQSSPSSATSLTSLKTLPNNVMSHSPRTRADSNGFNHQRYESPTPSTMSLQHPQMHNNINHQIAVCSQSLKNIKINTENHSPNIPQSYNHASQYSPQKQIFVQNQMMYQQQQAQPQMKTSQHSPMFSSSSSRQQIPQLNDHSKFIHRLHSFNHQMYQPERIYMASTNTINHITDDIRMKHMTKQYEQQQQQASPNHFTVSHSAGLGGYWTVNEHNQRVWASDVKYPLSPPIQSHTMAKKSNSLGNFDFMHQNDENSERLQADSVSISSGNSNELKKKEKVWCETSLDSPPESRKFKPKIESPTPSSYSATDYINNNHVTSQHTNEQTPPSSSKKNYETLLRQQQHISLPKPENGYYHNPLANVNKNNVSSAPNLPPKSKLRYTESTRSTISHRDFENNIVNSMASPINQQMHSPQLHVESPLNVTIIQEGSWKPYKEEIKSYEISDFYKYSEKYRQQQQQQNQQSNVN